MLRRPGFDPRPSLLIHLPYRMVLVLSCTCCRGVMDGTTASRGFVGANGMRWRRGLKRHTLNFMVAPHETACERLSDERPKERESYGTARRSKTWKGTKHAALLMNRIILSGGILLSFIAVHSQSDGSRGLCWAIAVFAFMWAMTNEM